MPANYYNVNLLSVIADIKAALIATYGAGLTVHYEDSENLIFGCSAVSDKVIRIRYASRRMYSYYGDSWTSGTTIVNSVAISAYNVGITTALHLVLGSSFMLYNELNDTLYSSLVVIGKLTNGNYVCLGLTGRSNYTSNNNCMLTSGVDVVPLTFEFPFTSSSGKLYLQGISVLRSDGSIEQNSDGSPAVIDGGLYNCSHKLTSSTVLKLAAGFMSTTDMYKYSSQGPYVRTCLFAEVV